MDDRWFWDYNFRAAAELQWPDDVRLARGSRKKGQSEANRRLVHRWEGLRLGRDLMRKANKITAIVEELRSAR